MATSLNGSKRSFHVYFNIIEARNIRGVEKNGKSDPYVTASRLINGKDIELTKTHYIVLTSHPQWWLDHTIDMGDAPSDITFKMYDWNKVLKSKKIGTAVLSHGAITAEGSYHKLDLGKDNGTLLVFAKRFTPNVFHNTFPLVGPPTRLLLDSVQRQIAHPGKLMRFGYLIRAKKPVEITALEFEINQHYHASKTNIHGSKGRHIYVRRWVNNMSILGTDRYTSEPETGASLPLNSKHLPYGDNTNLLPKTLCAGIHYFHIEFSYPSQDSCGRFIGSGGPEDIETIMTCGVNLADPKIDTLGVLPNIRKRDTIPLFTKSDYYLHLKPSLPYIFDAPYAEEDTEWLKDVKITWAVPDEGRNRSSPLPPHLYNPESPKLISEEDRKRWFISPDEDSKDAHGQERLYANLYWTNGGEAGALRRDAPHFLVLSDLTIDESAAQPSMATRDLEIDFSVQLVCDRFALSNTDKNASVRNQFIYHLVPTNKDVGTGKREYEIVRGGSPLDLIYSLPLEMYGHISTSFVYVEVIAINKAKPEQTWVLQRRPIFVEAFANDLPPSALSTPTETLEASGIFRVSYKHYPFIDRAAEVVGDFGEAESGAFGPDRLVRLMVPPSGPDGGFMDEMNMAREGGPIYFTDALPTPQMAELFEFSNIGSLAYSQDKTMDEIGKGLPERIKTTYPNK